MSSVFITATGVVTQKGVGIDAHRAWWTSEQSVSSGQFQMTGFEPAPYLSDRRLLKAVSNADAIGLVAIEDLKKTFSESLQEDFSRNGLYVGSPPGSAFDNQFYFESMEAARKDGKSSVKEFGATCMQSKPTTLLIGLPNNVLCYGSILLNVKGPNSNYTSTFLSGHIALINAAKRIRRGQVDTAVAGAFSMHSEKVNSSMFEKLGVATLDAEKANAGGMTPIADGAVFLGLTNVQKQGQKSLEFIDGAVASDGAGPLKFDRYGHCYEKLINDLLASNSVSTESVGLIFANSSGESQLDACENTVLSRVYANEWVLPALGCSRKVFGNLMEAGGLIELSCINDLYDEGKLPSQIALPEYNNERTSFTQTIDRTRPYALVLRASPWGEYSAVLVKTN